MSLESDLFALLSPLAGGRVFPDVAPLSTARPYVIYQQIGGEAVNYTDDAAPNRQHALMQISVWSDGRLQANTLARQIEDALRGAAAFQARPDGALRTDHEPDLNLYGASQDFSIWAAR